MKELAIIVVAYNREKSLARILNSLNNADYEEDKIDLIISIDKSNNLEVAKVAKLFEWKFGGKEVVEHEKNLGLRKHIILCGKYLERYDAIAIFEDDILVSPGYYNYMKQAVDYFYDNPRIAGISFYSYDWIFDAKQKFTPIKKDFDNYFMKYAVSWGQIWLKNQWFEFENWYNENYEFIQSSNVPNNVNNWPKSSWLKYHIKYCIENNKYFVFPFDSLTTNFSDVGEHNSYSNTDSQVNLSLTTNKKYFFTDNFSNTSVYDGFFENMYLSQYLKVDSNDLTIDLYGRKDTKTSCKYLLSINNYNYKIIKTFGLELKPRELNIVLNIHGKEIKLYDTSIIQKNNFENMDLKIWRYDNKNPNFKSIIKFIIDYLFKGPIKLRKRIFKRRKNEKN